MLRLGGAEDGEYAWSSTHTSKRNAKQDAARIALASLMLVSPGKEEKRALLGQGAPLGKASADSTTQQSAAAVEAKAMSEVAAGGASDISGWLREIGIAEDDVDSVFLHFNKPEYGVKTLREMFAFEEHDIDEILCSLPLAKRRLIKSSLKDKTPYPDPRDGPG